MKKAALLWILSLALGTYALEAVAQKAAPDQKIRIILQEKDGKETYYEYNSVEEMQADKRLKGKILPVPENARSFKIPSPEDHQLLMLKAEGMRQMVDSLRMNVIEFHHGDSLLKEHDILMLREPHAMTRRIREQMAADLPRVYFSGVDVVPHQALSIKELPEGAQKALEEWGLALEEGQRVVILDPQDSLPLPPAPPAPPAIRQLPPQPPMPEGEEGWMKSLQVVSNPATDQLRVQFQARDSGPAILRLLDFNGKEVFQEEIPDAAQLQNKTIRLPAKQKGLYLLQLEQAGKKYMQRVLIE